jgi:hypothetical protein
MPRRQRNRATVLSPRRVGNELTDRGFQRVPAHEQRVDRADVVVHGDLRAALTEVDRAQPATVSLRPRAAAAIEAHVMSEQQLAQPVPGTHQVAADVLTGADEVTQRLCFDRRHPDRVQAANHQQPQDAFGVATVSLDAIARGTLDLARRRDDALHAGHLKRPREPEPSRPGLIRHPHRPRQPSAERHHFARRAPQTPNHQLPGLALHRRGQHLRRVHIEPRPTANLCHVGTPMIAVGVQATPEPSTRAPHARVPTLTSQPDDGRPSHRV